MSLKLGRNDPCHCGSGKKYKKCHLPIDEQAHFASRISAPVEDAVQPPGPGADDTPGAVADWGDTPDALAQFSQVFKLADRSGLFERDPKLRRMFKENETLMTYLAHQEEIEAATEQLKPHQTEFERLCDDEAAYERQSRALFAEAAFAPFRFTAAELRQAFAEVGVPALDDPSSQTGERLRKALLLLATKERRDELSLRLLLLLPGYVREARHLDALIIESCALATAEEVHEPNPFLGRMFLFGLEAWGAQQDASRRAVLQEAGFQFGPEADPEAVESWLDQEISNPERAARWQRLVAAHPELQMASEDTSQLMNRKAVELLARPDAARLLLGPEEVEPWAATLEEKLQGMLEEIGPLEPGVMAAPAQTKQAFDQFYLPAIQDITKAIFTPERIRRLVGELRAYRKELVATGDRSAILCATSAIIYVERETEAHLNTFLVNLCAKSVMNFAAAADPNAAGDAAESQATPAQPTPTRIAPKPGVFAG